MSTPEDDLREQMIAASLRPVLNRNGPLPTHQEIADALLPLFAATRVAALEQAAVIAESDQPRSWPAPGPINGVYVEVPSDRQREGKHIAAAIRAAKEETP